MTKLYIAEYAGLGQTDQSDSVANVAQPPLAAQVVDYTAGATPSAAFNANTKWVVVHNDSICSLKFGAGAPVAAITDMRYAANERNLFRVNAGDKVSAITNT